jgi:predicted nucleotidyltransferase
MRDKLHHLCRHYSAVALYAFGSRMTEAVRCLEDGVALADDNDSDLDVGVYLPRGTHLHVRKKTELAADLEDLLGVSRVDLVLVSEASAFLALDIVKGELLVDLSPDETARFELYVMRRAADLAFFEKERRKMVLNEGAK